MPDLVGVLREPEYSPGRVADDAAILECTRDALAARGVTMSVGGIDVLAHAPSRAVLAMCQSAAALAALDAAAEHVTVINTPDAIRACHRAETVRRLAGSGVPFPATRMLETSRDDVTTRSAAPCWVKRGDVHAMAAADVVFAATPDEVATALADFARRGIAWAALQAHVPGTVVKFYGVADGRFFRCYADAADVPAPIDRLWNVAHAGAAALGLEVFGGDLVVTSDGEPVVVDLNDWPSFARCRDEAADAIAAYVVERTLAANGVAKRERHGTEART